MKSKIAALLLCLTPLLVDAGTPTAVYRGRVYTPQNFARGRWCSCAMCQSLRAQWATSSRTVIRTKTVTSPQVMRVKKTRTVMKTQRVMTGKRCVNGVCRPIYEIRMVPTKEEYWEVVEAEASPDVPMPPQLANTELQSTPQGAIEAVFKLVNVPKGSVFVDLGCGDGRLIEAASDRGFLAIGVELEEERARETRNRLRGRATVIQGDVRDFAMGAADVIYVWLYPELLNELDFPEDKLVISYSHEFKGSKRVPVGNHVFYVKQPKLEY